MLDLSLERSSLTPVLPQTPRTLTGLAALDVPFPQLSRLILFRPRQMKGGRSLEDRVSFASPFFAPLDFESQLVD